LGRVGGGGEHKRGEKEREEEKMEYKLPVMALRSDMTGGQGTRMKGDGGTFGTLWGLIKRWVEVIKSRVFV